MEAIKNFFGNLFSKVRDIIIAIIILVVAFYVAKFAKKLVVKLLKSVKAEAFLSKLGIKDTVTNSSIEFVGKLVYFVVFLLFLPGALDKLDLYSVSAPISGMVSSFLGFVPKLVAAGIIIVAAAKAATIKIYNIAKLKLLYSNRISISNINQLRPQYLHQSK